MQGVTHDRSGVAMAHQKDPKDDVFHEEILRLKEQIEELAAKIESCSKFILAAQIAGRWGSCLDRNARRGNPIRSRILWQREFRYCSAALLHGALTVAPQKR